MKKEFFHIPDYFILFLIKKEKKDSLLACYLFFVYLCVIIISVT